MTKVKCRDCGFLSVIDHYDTAVCLADDRVRDTGGHSSSIGRLTVARVFCYKNAREFEPNELHGQSDVVTAINSEIECGLFTTHLLGRTAKEHEEMAIVQKLEARTETWRAEEQQWQQGQEAAADRRHEESLKWQAEVEQKVQGRFVTQLAVQFLLALLAATIALIASRLLPPPVDL